jgi:hypothetical protein
VEFVLDALMAESLHLFTYLDGNQVGEAPKRLLSFVVPASPLTMDTSGFGSLNGEVSDVL